MRIAAYIASLLVTASLFGAPGASQSTKKLAAAKERDMFANNEFFAKGGIGMISEELYAVVKSAKNDRNELIVAPPGHLGRDQSAPVPKTRWKGKSASEAEVVFFFGGKTWSPQQLPDGFDLSKTVVVSFEASKVRFFDFRKMSGGYYERITE
jgi:hypothetical protein